MKKKKKSKKQSHAFFGDCRVLDKEMADKMRAAEQEKIDSAAAKRARAQELKDIAQFAKAVNKKLPKDLDLFYTVVKKRTRAQELKDIAQFAKAVNKEFPKDLNLFAI